MLKTANPEEKSTFRKYAPKLSLAVIAAGVALSPFALAQPRARHADQCTASVQTGSMPGFRTEGRGVTLLNVPLMQQDRYLSVTLPQSYVRGAQSAASSRPDDQRVTFLADVYLRNIRRAHDRRGTSDRVTFDCAPLTEGAASDVPSSSARDAGVPSARPADSGVRQQAPPPVSPDAGVTSPDGGQVQQRRPISF